MIRKKMKPSAQCEFHPEWMWRRSTGEPIEVGFHNVPEPINGMRITKFLVDGKTIVSATPISLTDTERYMADNEALMNNADIITP
jgi:hypothetical protein